MANDARNQGRVDRIIMARDKLIALLKDQPGLEKATKMRNKVKEYEMSLQNFNAFGMETKPVDRPVSVNVNVPLAKLGIKAHAPGS